MTFYDDASGERVELSVATYATWVAKTAGLLQDELDIEAGNTVLLDLPTHWLAPVWLGAAWSLGAGVTRSPASSPDVVVSGPGRLERHAEQARPSGTPVVGVSLLPLGGRFATQPPAGVIDYGIVVWGQPDVFVPADPPRPQSPAWVGGGEHAPVTDACDQAGLLASARASRFSALGTRLLTDLEPVSRPGLEAFAAPLLAGGGTVWVRHRDDARWDRHADEERVTARLDRGAQPPRS